MLRQLGSTALFAARFREAAARALLLPAALPASARRLAAAQAGRRSAAGGRPPASSRSCSRPTASACATCSTCRRSEVLRGDRPRARSRSRRSTSATPSPFAAALLFGYVANYIYDGDAPLAERRAQALTIDQAQLRELLGEAELRELLDPDA